MLLFLENKRCWDGSRRGFHLLPLLICFTVLGSVTAYNKVEERPWEEALRNINPRASPEEQEDAVNGLALRLLKKRSGEFSFRVNPDIGPDGKDTFLVTSPGHISSVDIVGTSGVAASWGLLHYLKYTCNAHVSWEADQLYLPSPLPSARINITSNDRYRYYQNVCTVSYSMVWWNWTRWEREIDWMALNGFNLPLAFTGQEAIWQRVYTQMGLTQKELDEHFAGPAFLSWARMGNIRGWGGPLPQSWHQKTLALQHQILKRMRQFGMTPVLPAFAGHVPSGLTRAFPTANVTRLGSWNNFNTTYSYTYLLDPSDPLFQKIGASFIDELTREFDTDHFYNCDTFNEMTPGSSEPEYLKNVGASIFKGMTSSDNKAIWVMQGWLFLNTGFWQKPQAEALLTSVPIGKMLILDLATEQAPQYSRLESYFGQPFIACMLHDYGGVDGFFGRVDAVVTSMYDVRKFPNVTIVGTGLTPEGINQNYVVYDLMNEFAWRTQAPNVTDWVTSYASRRYNSTDLRLARAWQLLMGSVYIHENGGDNGNYIIMRRPDISRTGDSIWYSVNDVVQSWDLFVEAIKGTLTRVREDKKINQSGGEEDEGDRDVRNHSHKGQDYDSSEESNESEEYNDSGEDQLLTMQSQDQYDISLPLTKQQTFLHDVVDMSRQMLQILGGQFVLKMIDCYKKTDLAGVQNYETTIKNLLTDLDAILATSPDFLLGKWTQGAASWATNEEERKLYVFNALNQITTWGPDANILDYAGKQWSGLITHYVSPRWELFSSQLVESLKNGTTFDQNAFNNQVFHDVEDALSKNVDVVYPSEPKGDTIAIALDIYSKYRQFFNNSSSFLKEGGNNNQVYLSRNFS